MDFYTIYHILTNYIVLLFIIGSIIKNILLFKNYTDFLINVIQTAIFAYVWPIFALYFAFTIIIPYPHYNIY